MLEFRKQNDMTYRLKTLAMIMVVILHYVTETICTTIANTDVINVGNRSVKILIY